MELIISPIPRSIPLETSLLICQDILSGEKGKTALEKMEIDSINDPPTMTRSSHGSPAILLAAAASLETSIEDDQLDEDGRNNNDRRR